MRNFKKILMVICVFAFLTVGCVLLAYAAENGKTGTVSALNGLLDASEAEMDANPKHSTFVEALEYLYTRDIDEAEDGYGDTVAKIEELALSSVNANLAIIEKVNVTEAEAYNAIIKAAEVMAYIGDKEFAIDLTARYDEALVKALGLLIDAIDEDIENSLKTATNQVAINRAKSVISTCKPCGDEDLLAELSAQFEELSGAHYRALDTNYANLDNNNAISDYELPVYFEENWQLCRETMTGNDLGGRWTIDLKGTNNQAGIESDGDDNKYYVHRYLEKNNPAASYIQIAFANHKVSAEQGLVFEFDIATFGDMPGAGLQIEPGGYDFPDGRGFPANYFFVDKDGNILTDKGGDVLLPNAFVKGQWLHIVIVFEPTEFVYKLYVAGEYIGKHDAKYNGQTYDHSKLCFRMSGNSTTYGEIAYDNISIYSGTSYRNHSKFETMTDDEKFIYYVNYLNDESKSLTSKYVAYGLATDMLGEYWIVDDETGLGAYTEKALVNQDIKDAVDSYLAYDVDVLLKEVRKNNLEEYIALVSKLVTIERNMETANQRLQEAEKVTAFLNRNDGLIDLELDNDLSGISDYLEYHGIHQRIILEGNYDKNAAMFIRYINRFELAPTLQTKERYYSRILELLNNGGIDINLITNENAPARENFTDLIKAYEIYLEADAVVYALVMENNAIRIVNCIARISEYDTEEEWLANREEMEKYLDIVKPIALAKDEFGDPIYNTAYAGVKEAVEYFNTAYAFFYALHQDEHVLYIQEKLDLVLRTDTYIEKMGYISVIERYVNKNDLDNDDPRIINLLNNLDTCKDELLLREEDYSKILVQNAVYFTNIVERMRTAQTYAEQRKYYEEAALLYFYIDSSAEDTARAVEIYDEYSVKLDRIAESSIEFIEAVAIYKACQTEDEKYAALVDCYYNAQFVEMSYEGAKEAMAEYQAAYDSYMNYANAVNADVVLSGNAIGSLRVNSGVIIVIAVIIKKIFGI